MKLRDFYKTNNKKQPIPGSNIRRKSKPPGHQWKEILDPCCLPTDIDCNCAPRFFVQLDGAGKPVSSSLIKRPVFPKSEENIKYMEIEWRSICCIETIIFNYIVYGDSPPTGSLRIDVSGVTQIATTINGTNGPVEASPGQLIEIEVINNLDGFCLMFGSTIHIDVTDLEGNILPSIDFASPLFESGIIGSFVMETGKNYVITAGPFCNGS